MQQAASAAGIAAGDNGIAASAVGIAAGDTRIAASAAGLAVAIPVKIDLCCSR